MQRYLLSMSNATNPATESDLLACPNCGDGISEDYDAKACAHCAWPLIWTAGVPALGILCTECDDEGHVGYIACDWCEVGNTWADSARAARAEALIDDAESKRIYHGWR